MSEFRIKHAECSEQLQYISYDENENINKTIKKPTSKLKIAVTTTETVWGKMRTTFQHNYTHSVAWQEKPSSLSGILNFIDLPLIFR